MSDLESTKTQNECPVIPSKEKPFNPELADVNSLQSTHQEPPQTEWASTGTLLAVIPTLLLCMFLVALDRLIISTAIPRITDEFQSLGDIAWYGSAYMLANCSTQLLYGRIYKIYNNKWVFLTAIAIFEIGSAVCGAAPSSVALIVGRAIAGAGASGIFSGSMQIVLKLVPLHKRPMLNGLFGGVFAISSVCGPLMGGAFTERISWRWCFYINLPFAAVAVAVVLFVVRTEQPLEKGKTLKELAAQLDPIGTLFLVGSVTCLILALQWGGVTYSWSSSRVVALLVLFGILGLVFIAVQVWKKDKGTIPPHIISQRSIAAGFIFTFCGASGMMIFVYYMSIWFQVVKGADPVKSGLMTLPLVIGLVIASVMAGTFTQKVGYYNPPMIVGPVLSSIGAGLLTTLTRTSGHAQWIGYQFLFGLGIGMAMQQPSLAAQAVLSKADVSIGIALMFFSQQLGGAVFLAVGQSVFLEQLIKQMSQIRGINPDAIASTGATDIRSVVKMAELPLVLDGYNFALTRMFFVPVGLTCAQVIASFAMEWKNIKKDKQPKQAEGSKA